MVKKKVWEAPETPMSNHSLWNHAFRGNKKKKLPLGVSTKELRKLRKSAIQDSLDNLFGKEKAKKVGWTNRVWGG